MPDIERTKRQALYNTAQWKALRKQQLSAYPLCAECLRAGRVTPAHVADHVRPHRGDLALFLDPSNLESLCDYRSRWNCHGSKTSREALVNRGVR